MARRTSLCSLFRTAALGAMALGAVACSSGSPQSPSPDQAAPNGGSDLAAPDLSLVPADMARSPADLFTSDLLSPMVTADMACEAHAQAHCSLLQRCSPGSFKASHLTLAGCVVRQKLYCLRFFGLPGSLRTGLQVQRCSTTIAAFSCDQYYDGSSLASAPDCTVAGTLAQGSACAASDQCASSYCRVDYTTGCGVCDQYIKENDACDYSVIGYRLCSPGLDCMGPSGAKKCARRAALGEACSDTRYCGGLLACRGGTCQPPRGDGEACDPMVANDCDYGKELFCDFTAKKCAVFLKYAAPGESCNYSLRLYCGGSGRCSSSTGAGTCVAPAADGAACAGPPTPPGCESGAECKAGTCQLPQPALCR